MNSMLLNNTIRSKNLQQIIESKSQKLQSQKSKRLDVKISCLLPSANLLLD